MTVAFKSPLTSTNLNDNFVSRTDNQNVTGKPNFTNGLQKNGVEITAIPTGGTTGQALVKASNSNFDVAWSTSAGRLAQVVHASTGAVSTTTSSIPGDDTIPQQSEGAEVITATITPTSATNKLKITCVFTGGHSASTSVNVALFQDSTADALAVVNQFTAGFGVNAHLVHYMDAGTTSATTFKMRAGGVSGSTLTINGVAGVRRFGGRSSCSITIEEIVV